MSSLSISARSYASSKRCFTTSIVTNASSTRAIGGALKRRGTYQLTPVKTFGSLAMSSTPPTATIPLVRRNPLAMASSTREESVCGGFIIWPLGRMLGQDAGPGGSSPFCPTQNREGSSSIVEVLAVVGCTNVACSPEVRPRMSFESGYFQPLEWRRGHGTKGTNDRGDHRGLA